MIAQRARGDASQGRLWPTDRRVSASAPERSEDADLLLAALDAQAQTVDELCERVRMDAARVQRGLLILTLRGDVLGDGISYRRNG